MAQDTFPPGSSPTATSIGCCIQGQRRDGVMGTVLIFGSPPLQWGRALGPPAVAQVEKAEPREPDLLVTVAAYAAKGYIQAELEYLPYFLFVNGQVKNYRRWGTGL